MCGFAGIVSFQQPIEKVVFNSMAKSLHHRGPDDGGFLSFDGAHLKQEYCENTRIGFIHRRLKIQDLGLEASQPFLSQDKRYALLFNGEIYNFIELRQQLEKKGYVFHSTSDTEVLLYSYIEWQEKSLDYLQGMFSFVVIDLTRNTLFMARDPFGIKPLYYSLSEYGFCFASEIKALWNIPWLKRKTNPDALHEMLQSNRFDFVDKTFYTDVFPLPPGHFLIFNLKSNQLETCTRYWSPDTDIIDISYQEAMTSIHDLWQQSMLLHTRSEVPVGAALSGGLDSSLIANTLKSIQHKPAQTFSYLASDPKHSELIWLETMEQHLGASSHKVFFKDFNLEDLFNKVIQSQDQPFGSMSILAQNLVYQKASEAGIKVLLNGQGADELFAGYYRSLLNHSKNLFRSHQWSQWLYFSLQAGVRYKMYQPQMLKALLKPTTSLVQSPWINKEWMNQQFQSSSAPQLASRQTLKEQLHSDLTRGGLLSLLRYDDHNAMANSIETRVPFLHKPLVEFVLRLPDDYLISSTAQTKRILRDAFRHELPNKIVNRNDKIGFTAQESDANISQATLTDWVDRIHALPFVNPLPKHLCTAQHLLFQKPLFNLLCCSFYLS